MAEIHRLIPTGLNLMPGRGRTMNTDELQEAMAEKRLSLRDSIFQLEQEAERRIRETMDHVQNRIKSASDEVNRTVTKPIHALQDTFERVPRALKSKPMQTLMVVASAGIALGFLMGRRGRNRNIMTRAVLTTDVSTPETRLVIPAPASWQASLSKPLTRSP
jgi:ElaB/YqjD/DUF883 family membrane-anchored ribosome-binding protein